MKQYKSASAEETKKIAANLAKEITQGVIALSGNLGAGKTTFVQGFARSLGIKDRIISPSFVLIRQHPIPKTKKILYHIDLYRLVDEKEFNQLGLTDLYSDPNNIVLIEWAEKLKDLPAKTIKINIEKKENNKRLIIIS